MYDSPPVAELQLEVVEAVIQHRIDLLKHVSCSASANDLAAALSAAGMAPVAGRPGLDGCGHALARLVCARGSCTASWFVEAEVRLFRWRVEVATPAQVGCLLCRLGARGRFVSTVGAAGGRGKAAGKDTELPCLGCGCQGEHGTPRLWEQAVARRGFMQVGKGLAAGQLGVCRCTYRA